MLAVLAAVTRETVGSMRGWRSLGAIIVLTALVAVTAHQLLTRWGIWLYVFLLEASILLAWGLTIAAESGKVSALLSRFVPSFLGRAGRRGGGEVQTIDATVLFSDIRQYTSTAERLDPADTLALLHSYHSAVEDIITDHGGTIVKTPGDAVLALFWQERKGSNHATCAFGAAQEMVADLRAHAETWKEHGVELDVGIGLNAGDVAIGLVGKHHLEPTVIGDVVNVAQRLESLTKEVGYQVVLGESVRSRLPEGIEAVFLDEMQVRGRNVAIRVYGVPGPRGAEHECRDDARDNSRERYDES
jgi:class 3 adenylate cyclase